MIKSSVALSWTSVNEPPIITALSIGKKSLCPDQLEAITGFPVIVNSNKGLPNPSPLVIETIALTLGWLYNSFISWFDNSPNNK
ncbi:hypothetical protein DCBHLPFO_00633 [Mycoplasmopsis arginini]|uniref:Uncharacterized protein n=1 Tax=Mycoplasmopsis arginini TaxID=2094 RepID=A0AA43U1S7_MYCAR|nr:hypothetical protein [Mycoplasmopsis arginini]